MTIESWPARTMTLKQVAIQVRLITSRRSLRIRLQQSTQPRCHHNIQCCLSREATPASSDLRWLDIARETLADLIARMYSMLRRVREEDFGLA